jgi:hypothetical protein
VQICINPNLSVPAPSYKPSDATKQLSRRTTSADVYRESRVQGDLFQAFNEFGLDIASIDEALTASSEPYDLCPSDQRMNSSQWDLAIK